MVNNCCDNKSVESLEINNPLEFYCNSLGIIILDQCTYMLLCIRLYLQTYVVSSQSLCNVDLA